MTKTATADREDFYCVHCGKDHGDHQAKTFNCPVKGRNSFNAFDKLHTFAPNYDKPLPSCVKI